MKIKSQSIRQCTRTPQERPLNASTDRPTGIRKMDLCLSQLESGVQDCHRIVGLEGDSRDDEKKDITAMQQMFESGIDLKANRKSLHFYR